MATIAYCNTIDWGFDLQQRPHHLMRLLSERGHMVYWVNKTHQEGKAKDKITDNFHVYHNWNVFKKRIPEIDIYFSSWSFRYVDLEQLKYNKVIYDSLDNFEQNSYEESNMISKSDVVLTTSQLLYELRSQEHNNIYMCRNGCFPELGKKQYDIPKELIHLKNANQKIVLFSGAVAAGWCDLELMRKVAGEFNLVVVGKGWAINEMPKNVIYAGCKPYDELQAFYAHCDVSILPFKRCQVSDFSNPIKMYEAMTHGKITVATDIPEAMNYPEIVLTSSTHTGFISNIYKALKLKDNIDIINQCHQCAAENSWHKRVDVIDDVIKGLGFSGGSNG